MKKTLLAVAVAAGAVILISPKIIANKIDSQIRQVVNSINDLPGYHASIVNTEQSWFNSTATLNISLDFAELNPAMAAQSPEAAAMFDDLNINVLVDAQHGPILLNKGLGLSDIHVSVPNTSDELTDGENKVENIYLFDGKVNLFGDLSYSDSFPAMHIAFPEGDGKFLFSGYEGTGETVQGNFIYSGTSTSMQMASPEVDLNISDITINWEGEFDIAKLMQGIYGNSKTSIVIGNFAATQATQSLFGWEDFELYANTNVDASDLMSMQAGYRIASLNTPIEKFEDIEIAFELNNLDQTFMKTYQELVLSMQTADAASQEMLDDLKEPVIQLLSHKPEVTITNVGFKTAAGTLQSNATVKLAEYDINETQLQDADFWQNNLLLDSGIDLPKGLALDLLQKYLMVQFQADPGAAGYTPQQLQELATQQSQMMLDNFMQGGFFTEENGQLQLAFNIANGMANLNGQEMPLEALMPAQQ